MMHNVLYYMNVSLWTSVMLQNYLVWCTRLAFGFQTYYLWKSFQCFC